MKISIITPVYEGNKYLDGYLKNVKKAVKSFDDGENHIEVIFVNDSPWIDIKYNKSFVEGFEVKTIINERNFGIHKSRINGVRAARGEYILFLDQDDIITDNSLRDLYASSDNADIVLGNGIFELRNIDKRIFGNNFSHRFAAKPYIYYWIRDFIVSPGQCLVKKNSIPEYWMNHPLKNNGTDDYFLWLLMLNENAKISCCFKDVYIHTYTGVNLSLDNKAMFDSTREMLSLLNKNIDFDKNKLKLIKRRIYYKKIDRSNKRLFFRESLKNIDILMVNIYYRLVWRGCLLKKGEA